jgi:translocon-associated protein subunit alpha
MAYFKHLVLLVLVFLSLALPFYDNVMVRAEDGVDSSEGEDAAADAADEEVYEETSQETDESEEYEDEQYEDEDDDVIKPAEDVVTTFLFPDHPDSKLPVGKDVTVLIGFANTADESYQVSHIGGYLHSPFDFNYYIQNFTFKGYGDVVAPTSEVTFEYSFKSDETLLPLEYWLSVFIQYNSTTNDVYRNTVYNATIEIYEQAEAYDAKRFLSSAVFALGALGVAVYIGYNVLQKLDKKAGRKPKEVGTRDAGAFDDSWTQGKVYKQAKKPARAGKKSGKGARKKAN